MTTLDDMMCLAEPATNDACSTCITKDISSVVSNLVLLQAYAQLTVQQPIIDPRADVSGKDLLPSLTQHQTAARRNAAYVNQTVVPAVIASLRDVLGFSSMVDAFIDAALPLAPRIVQSPAARAEVLALIQQIQREAAAREIATRDGATQLTVALSKVHADAANLRKDVEAANQVILSDKGELAKVQQEIDDIHRKIGGQIAAVVVSSVGIITGTVVVLVGALATLPSGASSTSVILAGVGMIVTGAGGLAAAASLLAADNARLASYYEKSIRLNTAVTLVKTVANQVNSMAAASNGLSEAAGALLTEWASIRAGMTSFQEQILRAADDSDAGRITTALEIARTHWRSVTNQTQTMMRRLVDLKPEEVKELPRPQSAAA